MEAIKYLSSNIKWFREQNGLTQTEFAEKIDKKTSAISAYETGQALPPIEVAVYIAGLLNVTLDQLLNSDLSVFKGTEKAACSHTDIQAHNLELLTEMQQWTGDFRPYSDAINELFYRFIGDRIDTGDIIGLTSDEVFFLKKAVNFFKNLKLNI